MNGLLLEHSAIKAAGEPKDLNGSALAGARVSLKECKGIAVVINAGDSTGAAFTVSFQQHDAASGGNSKALEIKANYYYKAGSATEFTKVELRPDDASLASSFDLAAIFAAEPGIVVFEVLDSHLDVNEDYAWMSVNIADSTAAKIVSAEYHLVGVTKKPAYELTV